MEDEAQRQVRRCRGRPEILITESELWNLLELQFTQVEISKLYGCSPQTISRIITFRLQGFVRFSDISDQDLDVLVSQFVVIFLNTGQNTLASYLYNHVTYTYKGVESETAWKESILVG